jgi:type VI secretion system protein ImpE
MNGAERYLQAGDLTKCLAHVEQEIRKEPAKASHRTFLFQLLAVLGEWDRALKQLDVLRQLDDSALAMVATYEHAVRCEALRARVFAGDKAPVVFGQPEPWMARVLQAVALDARAQHAQAQQLRADAYAAAPTAAGTIDGVPCDWIADADSRIGPFLEVVLNGRYVWVPFHRVAEIRIEKPVDLRDLVWLPAQFRWANGGDAVGLIPTRYPGSENGDDEQRMARKTEWAEHGDGVYFGVGQRMLATDQGEHPILDVRMVMLETAEGAGSADG